MASKNPSREATGAILLTADLLFTSHAQGAAHRANASLAVVSRPEDCLERIGNDCHSLVIVDLQLPSVDLEKLIPQIRMIENTATVIAYGPHVHESLLAVAKNAGCDEVLTRGQIHATIETILKQTLDSGL